MICLSHVVLIPSALLTQLWMDVPAEIQAAKAYRARIVTAGIEWALTLPQNTAPVYYTSKLAGTDDLQISRGLVADGRAHDKAQEGESFSYSEYRLLLTGGEQ